ncbi:hypothetical protein GQ602_004637 [Ophiocordyceps camponoti-floridani]|uniref:Uncharacterized protein n=1 Tax=Ophiocordyceps camponoti-floridani TaxID=2030778 RepID=A0A8H4VCE5_9HYPO|nr:hypothetical protein GQ602_004637 [Ophiocordyceps camponoti-floridani]
MSFLTAQTRSLCLKVLPSFAGHDNFLAGITWYTLGITDPDSTHDEQHTTEVQCLRSSHVESHPHAVVPRWTMVQVCIHLPAYQIGVPSVQNPVRSHRGAHRPNGKPIGSGPALQPLASFCTTTIRSTLHIRRIFAIVCESDRQNDSFGKFLCSETASISCQRNTNGYLSLASASLRMLPFGDKLSRSISSTTLARAARSGDTITNGSRLYPCRSSAARTWFSRSSS